MAISKRMMMKKRRELYKRAFLRSYEQSLTDGHMDEDLPKLVFYGVKFSGYMPGPDNSDERGKMGRFHIMNNIVMAMERLTPKQFMQIFPIDKRYARKWKGSGDYFRGMDHVRLFDMDDRLGDSIMDFLSEYSNTTIELFVDDLAAVAYWLQQREGGAYIGNSLKKTPRKKAASHLKRIK